MKRLIAILFVLCAAGFVVGEMMDPDINELEDDGLLRISDVESVDIIMSTPDGELEFEVVGEEYRLADDGIRTLAKSGRICEVLGLSCPCAVGARNGPPEIVMILDRSGSMEDMESEMEEAIGSFLAKQPSGVVLTLVQFDDQYEVICERKPIADVNRVDIKPRGRTALLDAMGRTIASVAHDSRAAKVSVVVITDGLENDSTEYTRERIFDTIRHLTDIHGWQFIYLGANQDAIAVGRTIGIDTSWTYDLDILSTTVDCAATSVSDFILNEGSSSNNQEKE